MPAKNGGTDKTTKRGKGGSKGGGGEGGDKDNLSGGNDPIIITGGGSVELGFNRVQFKDRGPFYKNDTAELVSIQIDGGAPIPLDPKSMIKINMR